MSVIDINMFEAATIQHLLTAGINEGKELLSNPKLTDDERNCYQANMRQMDSIRKKLEAQFLLLNKTKPITV